MTKHISLAGLALLFLLSGCNEKTSTEKDEVAKSEDSLLWKIEGNGLSEPSYLFGTIHIIPEDLYEMGDLLEATIRKSDKLITEVEMGDLQKLAFSPKLNYDNGNWIDSLPEENQILILDGIKQNMGIGHKMGRKVFGTKKPFMVYSTLMIGIIDGGYKTYEEEITNIAEEEGIENMGLEEAEFQLSIFDRVPHDTIVNWILTSLRDYEKFTDEFGEMFELYQDQKINALVESMDELSPEFKQYEDAFLYDRNSNWIPVLEEEMKKQSCFIAVGAAHLPGERGVIGLLQKAGYTVTPIKTSSED